MPDLTREQEIRELELLIKAYIDSPEYRDRIYDRFKKLQTLLNTTRTELAEARKERDATEERLGQSLSDSTEEHRLLTSRLTQLTEALEEYGRHDEYNCDAECQRRSVYTKESDPKQPCTCGFDTALGR